MYPFGSAQDASTTILSSDEQEENAKDRLERLGPKCRIKARGLQSDAPSCCVCLDALSAGVDGHDGADDHGIGPELVLLHGNAPFVARSVAQQGAGGTYEREEM